jgi:putative flavoprotein involved in K+ transport
MVGVQDGLPVLDDGRVLDVANVIWCTGFRPDYGWIDLPLMFEDGYPRQYKGAAESLPGVYFVGMLFLHSFSSMLILGAGRDAERVAKHIAAGQSRPAAGIDDLDETLVWNGMVTRAERSPTSSS